MFPALDLFAAAYPDWEGTKLLCLLSHYPGEAIPAATLERCLNEGISPAEANKSHYRLAPIPMTDSATLKAIDKRLNQLIALKAEGLAHSDLLKISESSTPRHSCSLRRRSCEGRNPDPLSHGTSRPLDLPTSRL